METAKTYFSETSIQLYIKYTFGPATIAMKLGMSPQGALKIIQRINNRWNTTVVIKKRHYVAPIKPEVIYMQWLNLTVSPMSISDELPHDP